MMRILKYSFLFFAVSLLHCVAAPQVAGQFSETEFEAMADKMARGKVKDLTVEQVKNSRADYILLDTRERGEYEVSHIEGAIWVGYDDFSIARISQINPSKKIVTYCSVGYRSERIGEQLQQAGYSRVYNLHGSIFKWINEGYPVVDKDGNPTQKVHGYNQKWEKWVKGGDVVY